MSLEDTQKRLMNEFGEVDALVQVVLKGHLLIEEKLTEALETYLLHGKHLDNARLQFHQKLSLCKGISTGESDNNMWNVIKQLNNLRNSLSHSLAIERRQKALDSLKSIYDQEFRELEMKKFDSVDPDVQICFIAITGCLGFLDSFLSEVKRLKQIIIDLDQIMNDGNLSLNPLKS